MKKEYNIKIKIPKAIYQQMILDLERSHEFAYERVGFLMTKSKVQADLSIQIIALEYFSVSDLNYVNDDTVGAKINSVAIREAMQKAFDLKSGCFHVHMHFQKGKPFASKTDINELPGVVNSLANISPNQCNGFLILSGDSFYADVKVPGNAGLYSATKFSVVGYPMKFQFDTPIINPKTKVFDRQSFLGKNSQFLFENVTVGIVGYGGGGSHIGQQLAHLGLIHQVIFDDDTIDETNLNRLIGGWFEDIKNTVLKTTIAQRIIEKILPTAKVNKLGRWQNNSSALENCDIVFGCVDSYNERNQLEAHCRRYLIPYIDIGMDIYGQENSFSVSGQIILSMPNDACLNCFGFLTEEKLAREAAKYGDAGGRPQVVWSNGVLASTAVGILVDLISGWSNAKDKRIYTAYDGNLLSLSDHIRLKYTTDKCQHFPLNEAGPPSFKKL